MVQKASLFALLAAAGLAQGPVTASPRDRAAFRSSLTATVVVEGARDSVASNCRLVTIEWQRLVGATSYQVQVRVGSHGAWVAVRGDPRCGGGRPTGPTDYQDRVMRPAALRFYRVVALAPDGRSLDVTQSVPVGVR